MTGDVIHVDQEIVVKSHHRGTIYEAKDAADASKYVQDHGGVAITDSTTGKHYVLSDGIKNINSVATSIKEE